MYPVRNRFLLIYFLFFALVLAGCGNEPCKRYHFPQWYFSICFPKDWTVKTEQKVPNVLAELPVGNRIPIVRDNVSILIHTIKKPMTLDEYLDRQQQGMQKIKNIHNISVGDSGEVIIDNITAKWRIYSYSIADLKLKSVVYYLIKDRSVYVITGISDHIYFSDRIESYNKAARSLRFD